MLERMYNIIFVNVFEFINYLHFTNSFTMTWSNTSYIQASPKLLGYSSTTLKTRIIMMVSILTLMNLIVLISLTLQYLHSMHIYNCKEFIHKKQRKNGSRQ